MKRAKELPDARGVVRAGVFMAPWLSSAGNRLLFAVGPDGRQIGGIELTGTITEARAIHLLYELFDGGDEVPVLPPPRLTLVRGGADA